MDPSVQEERPRRPGVTVTDLGARQPSAPRRLADPVVTGGGATAEPLAESGRGPQIIAALAQTWSVQDLDLDLDLDPGLRRWFRLPVTRTAQALAACSCTTTPPASTC